MEQKWTLNNIIVWAQRICTEKLPDNVGLGADIFEGIEASIDALQAERDALQQRITELETELTKTKREAQAMTNAGIDLQKQVDILAAQLTAAPVAARWEYVTAKVVLPEYVCTHYLGHEGWELICAYPDGEMIVSYWKRQRPARQEEAE